MNRRHALIAGVAAVAGAAGIGLASRRGKPDDATALWTLSFERPQGGTLAMADYRGRPLLLNFWAPWCAPCVVEMPLLDRFHAEQRSRGWSVVGLAVDRLAPVQEFLQRQPVRFPIALAGAGGLDLGRQLGNAAGGLPFSIALQPDGRVLDRRLGELDAALLQRWAGAANPGS